MVMQQVSRSAFLEIRDSMLLLKSIYDENQNNHDEFAKGLESWAQKHKVNILSGASLVSFGWAIVARFFELTKNSSGELPKDLVARLHELAGQPKFYMASMDKVSTKYGCVMRTFDETDARDHGIMICSMIRHLRNAFSHFDCHYNNDLQRMRIRHIYKDKPKIDMELGLDNFLKLVGDIGILFLDAITELNALESDANNMA